MCSMRSVTVQEVRREFFRKVEAPVRLDAALQWTG